LADRFVGRFRSEIELDRDLCGGSVRSPGFSRSGRRAA
jgi:hypothetical protein